jgi:hypothetical protein
MDFWGMISREDYKEPKISPCREFFGDRVHEARKVEMREKVQVDVPLSNMGLNLFVEGRQKLVRG